MLMSFAFWCLEYLIILLFTNIPTSLVQSNHPFVKTCSTLITTKPRKIQQRDSSSLIPCHLSLLVVMYFSFPYLSRHTHPSVSIAQVPWRLSAPLPLALCVFQYLTYPVILIPHFLSLNFHVLSLFTFSIVYSSMPDPPSHPHPSVPMPSFSIPCLVLSLTPCPVCQLHIGGPSVITPGPMLSPLPIHLPLSLSLCLGSLFSDLSCLCDPTPSLALLLSPTLFHYSHST